MYALSVDTGEHLWEFKADGAISTPGKISRNLIVFGDAVGRVYAVDIAKGELVWKTEGFGEILCDLSIDYDRVYVTSGAGGNVLALDLQDGSKMWLFKPGNTIYAPAVAHRGRVYVSVQAQGTYALDAGSGKQNWLNKRTDSARFTIADNGRLFLGNHTGYAVALDSDTGDILWQTLVNRFGIESTGAISAESLLVATWNREIASLSKTTGEFNWISKLGDEDTVGTPTIVAVSGDSAYVNWNDSPLYAVDLRTGSIGGTGIDEDFASLSTTASLGFVYAGSDDGKLHASRTAVSGPIPEASTHKPTPQAISFEPLTPGGLRKSLEELAKRDSIANDGQLQEHVARIAETSYHLTTGRAFAQDAIIIEFNADICDDAAGYLGLRARSLVLLICAGLDPTSALITAIHESGHALENALDPLPESIDTPDDTRISLLSFSEARAQIFEAAGARELASYVDLDVEAFMSNNDRFTTHGDNQVTQITKWNLTTEMLGEWVPKYDAEGFHLNIHGVGYLLAWLGVFHDDELAGARRELEQRGHLSPSSLMTVFNRLGNLDDSAFSKYVSLVQSEDVSKDIVRIAEHLGDRDNTLTVCNNSYQCIIGHMLMETLILP